MKILGKISTKLRKKPETTPPQPTTHMESCPMEPSCQDGANCHQMPRRAANWNRPAARCPGPYGELPDGTELPGWSQLPDAHDTDAQDHMESCPMEPSCQDGANCQMPTTHPPRAAKWNHPGPRPSCWSN